LKELGEPLTHFFFVARTRAGIDDDL